MIFYFHLWIERLSVCSVSLNSEFLVNKNPSKKVKSREFEKLNQHFSVKKKEEKLEYNKIIIIIWYRRESIFLKRRVLILTKFVGVRTDTHGEIERERSKARERERKRKRTQTHILEHWTFVSSWRNATSKRRQLRRRQQQQQSSLYFFVCSSLICYIHRVALWTTVNKIKNV